MERMEKEMPTETLLDLYRALERKGVKIWIDGGWAVDALLGEQTRPHDDVDFVVQEKDLSALVSFLRSNGYADIPRDDTRPWNFVLGDEFGHEVDIHVICINDSGDGIYGPPENGQTYPAYSLTGTGGIGGHAVACMSLEYQIANHTGYKPRDKDIQDMEKLCKRFNRDLPSAYENSGSDPQ